MLFLTLGFTGVAQADSAFRAAHFANIDYQQLAQLMKNDGLLIDVRRPEEWERTGVISNSKLITLFDKSGKIQRSFFDKLVTVAKNPDQPIAVICRTGHRSRAGSQILRELGYRRVYNVAHGITGWIKEGLIVVRPPSR